MLWILETSYQSTLVTRKSANWTPDGNECLLVVTDAHFVSEVLLLYAESENAVYDCIKRIGITRSMVEL